MKKLLLAALLLLVFSPAYAAVFGPLFSGSSQTPTTGHTPVVTSKACTVALPVVNGTNVNLVGGGTCNYTATCNSIACNGGDAITSWAITAQSTANSFSIVSASGVLRGGSAAGSVTAASYTVTITATNATGTSPGVVQTVTVVTQPPVVSSLSCTIKTPITNNTNVTLQAGGNCQYTATGSPTSWTVASSTCTGCYQVTNAGILQGGTNAATVVNRGDVVTVTATNAGGTSAGVGQTVTAISAPVITNQNCSVTLPITNAMPVCNMSASPLPASWAITAVSTVTTCPQGMSFPTDGCTGAPVGSNLKSGTVLVGYAHRPPWNVAGLDYGVGPNPNVTISLANPVVFTETSHGHVAGTKLSCYTYGTLPSHIPTSVLSGSVTQVFVIAAGLTTNTYEVSLTNGGSAISTLGDTQSGTHFCLKDPSQTLPSGVSLSSQTINMTGASAVLDHYDASLAGGYVVSASSSGQTISNNVFVAGAAVSAQNQSVQCTTASSGCSVNNNYFDGGGSGNSNSEILELFFASGTSTAMYNYFTNYQNDTFYIAASVIGNSVNGILKYNVAVGGPTLCGHADILQIGSGTYTLSILFNTFYAPAPACGTQGWMPEGNVGQDTITSVNIGNNTSIIPTTPGNGGSALAEFTGITPGTATGAVSNVHDNYFDPTSMGSLVRGTDNSSNFICTNNINMITGAIIKTGACP